MKRLINIVGLQTPAGRLIFFLIITIFVFFAPFSLLSHLSPYQHLGIPSPSIGLTRAYHHLLHLDAPAAWRQNKLIFLVLAIGLPLLGRDLWMVVRARKAQANL